MAGKSNVTAKKVMELVESQRFRCSLSGRELTPETASLDHVLPLGRGGVHDISNVSVVDHQVNSAKGAMTVDEFIQVCRDVSNHARNYERNAIRYLEKNDF